MTHDRITEKSYVEDPLLAQLAAMGWETMVGDTHVPYLTERESFREVILRPRLEKALRFLNRAEDGTEWLDESRIKQAVGELERLGAHKLMEANRITTDLLLGGASVDGDPRLHGGREATVRYIDFDHPANNDLLAVSQFKVDPGGNLPGCIPDIVIFINGIPVVVIECKNPNINDPIDEAINQLLRYSHNRGAKQTEGCERLFHYNQLMIATCFDVAKFATIGAGYDHYHAWKDTAPTTMSEVAERLGVNTLSPQQILAAGMLDPQRLLDIIRHFILFRSDEGRTIKIASRYQQYRAVQHSVQKLKTGKTRAQTGENDERGGIIWHTQGSGKSLTMVFLVRKMRSDPVLRKFKVVIVTDRKQLQKQLGETAEMSGESVRRAPNAKALKGVLAETGPDLVFAMIQKYRDKDETDGYAADRDYMSGESFQTLNDSEEILIMVDEAHRTHGSRLHANLMAALPNCAKIGFTGTPIIMGAKKKTFEIFGEFIDRYTIQQSEADGATVPILYEGRTAGGAVKDGHDLDELFIDLFQDRTEEELEAIKKRYATKSAVAESPALIAEKANDMIRHYVGSILPNGFKTQVVATSREAAVRYQKALQEARDALVCDIEALDGHLLGLDEDALLKASRDAQFKVRASKHLDTIKRLEFVAIISQKDHNDPPHIREWTDETLQEKWIERFKKPLLHENPDKQDGLAFLCVKSMLITGFDAPNEQAMYIDRFMKEAELLQAIARVNRKTDLKKIGMVVDYFGIARHLREALQAYSDQDIEGALGSFKDQLPILRDRRQRVLAIFEERKIALDDEEACVELLENERVRADFTVKLKEFLGTLDNVMPRPEGIPFLADAKRLGGLNHKAKNRFRDPQMNIKGAGEKVRAMIDQHIISTGIDPKIPPIRITDANFDQAVSQHISPRAKASEMEHAARYHITEHLNEDPVYYEALSERLESILKAYKGNWEEMVQHLEPIITELREGLSKKTVGNLDGEREMPFFRQVAGVVQGELTEELTQRLIAFTHEIVQHVQEAIRAVDFWRRPQAQQELRAWLFQRLDDLDDLYDFDTMSPLADRLIEVAKANHPRLTE